MSASGLVEAAHTHYFPSSLEGSSEKASVINARKIIYKRINDLWPPDGWTTTTAISRECEWHAQARAARIGN